MNTAIETFSRNVRILLTGMMIASSFGCSADQSKRDENLKGAIGKAFSQRWQQYLVQDSPKLGLTRQQVRTIVDEISAQSVDCFRKYSADSDADDVELFEGMMVAYKDIFGIPNWKADVDLVIDARYGDGASLARGKCDERRPESVECKIKKSYDAVWADLYAGFYKCIAVSSAPYRKLTTDR